MASYQTRSTNTAALRMSAVSYTLELLAKLGPERSSRRCKTIQNTPFPGIEPHEPFAGLLSILAHGLPTLPPRRLSQSFCQESSNVADLSTLNQLVGEPVASVAVVAVVAGHVGRSRPAARATNLAVAAAPDLPAAKIWL